MQFRHRTTPAVRDFLPMFANKPLFKVVNDPAQKLGEKESRTNESDLATPVPCALKGGHELLRGSVACARAMGVRGKD